MGADIHGAIETKVNDKWVMVSRLDYRSRSTDRNYTRFARLASVRGDGPEPNGIPDDVSESTMLYINEWDSDGHSHGYMDLEEIAQIFLETDYKPLDDYIKKYPMSHYFDIETEAYQDNYRVIFWFDN